MSSITCHSGINKISKLDKFPIFIQARKEDAEKKRLEALEKKRERDALLAEEAEKEKGKQVCPFVFIII